jgi:uncharacterized phage protein gp47/JayE
MSAPTKKTAKQISDIFVTTLEAEISQSVPLMPRAFIRLFSKLMGIVFVVLFQYSEFIAMQSFIRFASDKPITIGGITYTPLDMWGEQIGLKRNLGQRSDGTIEITVLVTGGTLLSGSVLLDPNTQETYLTVADVSLSSSSVSATVRATNYKTSATLYVDQSLSFVSAPPEIEKVVTVATVTQQGADAEDTDSWRQRQLDWWSARPQGGASADYREWGSEVSGVENIYPYSGGTSAIPTSGPGQVDIYVEASNTVDGIAPQALLDAVKDNIEQTASTGLADRRPINCYVNTASIYRKTVNATIAGLVVSDTSTVQTAIEEALEQYLLSRENYIIGLSRLPRRDVISESEASGVVGRVVSAYGGTVNSLSFDTITQAYVLEEGEKAKLGTVTWT